MRQKPDRGQTRGEAATRQPKGRAATANPSGRYERLSVEPLAPEASELPDDDEERSSPLTQVTEERTRRALSTNDSPDIPFDRSVNPYRGCEHGCIYCFARPSHAYLGLSPGLDFETRIVAKPDAPEVLRRELSRRGYRPANDRARRQHRSLPADRARAAHHAPHPRGALRASHPVSIVTKSALVLRDLDLLSAMAARRLAHVHVSITTLDPELARTMEPRASTPERRLGAVARLTAAGVPTGVLASPMIPGLNDHELEAILTRRATPARSRPATFCCASRARSQSSSRAGSQRTIR